MDERKDARMEVRLSRELKAAIKGDAAELGVSAAFLLLGCHQLWARERPKRRQEVRDDRR